MAWLALFAIIILGLFAFVSFGDYGAPKEEPWKPKPGVPYHTDEKIMDPHKLNRKTCPRCGSTNTKRWGTNRSRTELSETYECNYCGKMYSARISSVSNWPTKWN